MEGKRKSKIHISSPKTNRSIPQRVFIPDLIAPIAFSNLQGIKKERKRERDREQEEEEREASVVP